MDKKKVIGAAITAIIAGLGYLGYDLGWLAPLLGGK